MKRDAPIQDTPPHSVEAEKGVLSSILQSRGKAIPECVQKIRAEFFYVPAHQTIYGEMLDTWESGQPIDLITFCQRLRDKKLLESVGGDAYVTGLQTFAATDAAVEYYLDIVWDKFALRQIIATGTESVRRAHDEQGEPAALLDEIESKVASLRSLHGRNGTRISFRSPSEILAMPRNAKANFLGDRLLGVARSLVLAGIGGIGKSRLLLQLLVAFILGRIWCGIETHHTKGQPWMLVQTQNGTQRLQDDLEALKRYAGRDWSLVEKNLLIHTLETDRDLMLHLSAPENVRDLESDIRQRNPIGVAFDPLNEVGIGDLSKDVDMMATCSVIGRISRAGNPERAIVIATHAITGLAGMKKAFGFEAAGFGRNSKVLGFWTRAQINIIPGTEDHSVLVFICGKLNDGKMFSPFAVRLNPDTMIYEPEPDFDIEGLRERVESTKGARTPSIKETLHDLLQRGHEYDKPQIAKLIMKNKGVSQATAYRWVDKGQATKVLRFNKQTEIYALA